MKTTIDLADDLAATVKRQTAAEGTTLRAAVHEALRLWLKNRESPPALPRISPQVGVVDGQGLTAEASRLGWEEVRALSYGEETSAHIGP